MKTTFKRSFVVFLIASLLVFPQAVGYGGVQAKDFHSPAHGPSFTTDGVSMANTVGPRVVVVDPNPDMQGIQIPVEPEVQAAIDAAVADPEAISATFSITYLAAGATDAWGNTCQTFPTAARTAFNAGAAIWGSTLQSPVPITISACWADLGSSSILGYSGYQYVYRDFPGAIRANTWYAPALANAQYGSDLDSSVFDDNSTLNSGFSWYTGTDGVVPAGQYDLMTVVAHEIAHSLNFSGSAKNSSGSGSYGVGGYPFIYDTFMEDLSGTALTSYINPSTALGSLLTSGSLWFDGTNANAANGNSRVRIYAPSSWANGSSYTHLDYTTFAGGANSMMVYALGSGSSQHNPGPVTKGLLKDLGWTLAKVSSTTAITNDTPDPSIVNQSYTVSVAVSGSSGTPTGTVNISDGSANCAATLSGGSGSCSLTSTTTGTKTLTATYSGDSTYNSSSGTTAHTVNPNAPAQILLVDDDDNDPDVRSYYTAALSALGATYDIWATNNSDTEPDAADLASYDTVIWFTGAAYGGAAGPGAAGEAALGTWLDGGGCYLLSSQDYLYDRGLTAFGSTYLGVGEGSFNDVAQTIVNGSGSVFGGLGSYTLSYPFSNYSDLVSPDATAEIAFEGDKGNAAVDKDGGIYHTAFLGFPFEAIAAAADRQQVMGAFLSWCVFTPTVYVKDVYTTDQNGLSAPSESGPQAISGDKTFALKTDFRPGDPIRLYIQANNQLSTTQTAYFEWIVLDPDGYDVPALEYAGNGNTPAGIANWYVTGKTIPADSKTGWYTFIGRVTYNAKTTAAISYFYVSQESYTAYLPVVIRGVTTPTYFEGPWEQEDNDTSLQANGPLRSAQDYYGYPNDQKDYFSINPGTSGQIVIDLTNVTGSGVQLQLFYQVADVDHRVAFDRDAPYHIEYTGGPGVYYIYIYTESGYNSSNAYTLRVTYP